MKETWLPLDNPEMSAKWLNENGVYEIWQQYTHCQCFVAQCKQMGPARNEHLGHARRLMRQLRDELVKRGAWDI